MKNFPRLIPLLGAALGLTCAGAAFAQENYNASWSGHKYVIINSVTAGTLGSVARYPLLVRLDSTQAAIFTQAKAGGADLRFTRTDNTTRLPHQIESWNATAKTAAIWVLVDSVHANRTNLALRIHWGNALAADSSSGAQVFDTTNNFQAVWHMGGSTSETDATRNGFNAAQVGTAAVASGAVAGARVVSSGNYFRATGTASGKLNFPEGSNYTLSSWVLANSFAGHGTILSKHDNAYALKLNADATSWEFFEFGSDATVAGWNWVNGFADGVTGVWNHVTGIRSEFDIAIYVNGVRMDGGFATATSTAARVTARDVTIGAQPAASNTAVQRPFDGVLDEVRMSNAARDPDWILLDYMTQKSDASVVSFSDTIPVSLQPAGHAPARVPASFSVRAAGGGLVFRLPAATLAHAAKARVTVLDMRGAAISSGIAPVQGGSLAWNGKTGSGQLAPSGVYAVRITLWNAEGKSIRTLTRRVAFTR